MLITVQVESAGFTIAPLRPGFSTPGEASHESLVTAVFKVDLGGWLSQDTWTGRCLAPFLRQSFTDTLASCAIWLRDRVCILFQCYPNTGRLRNEMLLDNALHVGKLRQEYKFPGVSCMLETACNGLKLPVHVLAFAAGQL